MIGDPQAEQQRAQELLLENEARMRLELDGAYVGLFEWDLVTHRSQWSTGFYQLHGLEPGGEASYELWRGQVHPDDLPRVEGDIRRAIEQNDSVDTDYRIIHPDGELRWTLLQARVKRDDAGHPLSMKGNCGDITRRKLADAALLESEKLAIAGRMSAALAHEINNPLEAAYNLVYLARAIASAGEQADLLDETMEQLRRVSEISHQTLRFVRPARPRWIKVDEVVQSTLRLLGPKLALSALNAKTDFRDGADLWCSSGELQQILTNLLNNAASRQSRQVTIRVRNAVNWRNRGRRGVRITIADTGPGMTPETLQRLREPFFTTKDGTGTGLGMWVVQQLLEKLRGAIAIRSSTDAHWHGTAMSLFFPSHGPERA